MSLFGTVRHSLRRGGQRRRGAFALALMSVASAGAAGQASFKIVTDIPSGFGPGYMFARAMTDDGDILGVYIPSSQGYAHVRKNDGTWIALEPAEPGGDSNLGYPWRIDAMIPGVIFIGGKPVPALWTDYQSLTQPVAVPPQFPAGGGAGTASFDGTILGGGFLWTPFSGTSWVWTQPTGTTFLTGNPPGTTLSSVYQISWEGSVTLGSETTSVGTQAFLWNKQTGFQYSGTLPGGKSTLLSKMTPDALVRVGRASNGMWDRAVRWTDAHGLVDLGDLLNPTAPTAQAWAVSWDGWTIFGESVDAAAVSVFIWNPIDGMRSVEEILTKEYGMNIEQYNLGQAAALSPNGQWMSGTGADLVAGKIIWWIAELPPFCYADCDRGTGKGVLDVFDFLCYMSHFDQQDVYSNCNNDGAVDFFDFLCFIKKWHEGCP